MLLKMMLVIGIQNGFEGGVVKKIIESGGNGVCWVKAYDVLADFITYIMKGVSLGNIVFHLCGFGRRLECSMRNSGVVE